MQIYTYINRYEATQNRMESAKKDACTSFMSIYMYAYKHSCIYAYINKYEAIDKRIETMKKNSFTCFTSVYTYIYIYIYI